MGLVGGLRFYLFNNPYKVTKNPNFCVLHFSIFISPETINSCLPFTSLNILPIYKPKIPSTVNIKPPTNQIEKTVVVNPATLIKPK